MKAKSVWHDGGSPMYHKINTVKDGSGFVLDGDIVGIPRFFKKVENAQKHAQKLEPKKPKGLPHA